MKVCDAIAQWLEHRGITHAFGIVGGGNVALWDAIARHQKTQLVSVHHEQAAAMAASYFYRVAARPALCLVTTGAGSANAITGVLAAFFDSIPLMIISGNEASRFLSEPQRVKGTQGYDSVAVAKGFTKRAFRMCAGDDVTAMLDWAWATAEEGRGGPVWIDIPKDVQTHEMG